MSLPQRAIVFLIQMYRVIFTPVKVALGVDGCCRFRPTCSKYAEIAVCEHGACRGAWLAAGRLLKCHPFGPSGYDPVPSKNGKLEGKTLVSN